MGKTNISIWPKRHALSLLCDCIVQPCLKCEERWGYHPWPRKIYLLHIASALARRAARHRLVESSCWITTVVSGARFNRVAIGAGPGCISWQRPLSQAHVGNALTHKRVEISHVLRSTSCFPVCKQQGPLGGLHLSWLFLKTFWYAANLERCGFHQPSALLKARIFSTLIYRCFVFWFNYFSSPHPLVLTCLFGTEWYSSQPRTQPLQLLVRMKGTRNIADLLIKVALRYHSINSGTVHAWSCSHHLVTKTKSNAEELRNNNFDTHHLQHLEIAFELNFPVPELTTFFFYYFFLLISSP